MPRAVDAVWVHHHEAVLIGGAIQTAQQRLRPATPTLAMERQHERRTRFHAWREVDLIRPRTTIDFDLCGMFFGGSGDDVMIGATGTDAMHGGVGSDTAIDGEVVTNLP